MAGLAQSEDRAIVHIQCGKQRCGAVTHIIVRDALGVAQPYRQHWLCWLERPALTPLVDVQIKRLFRRIQIQTDDIAQLRDEQRIGRGLKGLSAMRLQPAEA